MLKAASTMSNLAPHLFSGDKAKPDVNHVQCSSEIPVNINGLANATIRKIPTCFVHPLTG